jgi:hypothetical protein
MHEVLTHLQVNNKRTTPLPLQLESMVEQGASVKGHRVTPDGLACEITHLPPCLQAIYP